MAVSVVKNGSQVLINLQNDTAVESDVAQGKWFHKANGERVQGIASGGGNSFPIRRAFSDWDGTVELNTIIGYAVLVYSYESTSLDFTSYGNITEMVNMDGLFEGMEYLETINLSNFNTLNTVSMSGLFVGCTSLQTLNLSNFDTSNLTDANDMFNGCTSLQTLNLSNFDTSNLTQSMNMFDGCTSLQTLDIRNFSFISIEDYDDMFHNIPSTCVIYVNQAFYDFMNTYDNNAQRYNYRKAGLADLSMLQVVSSN